MGDLSSYLASGIERIGAVNLVKIGQQSTAGKSVKSVWE